MMKHSMRKHMPAIGLVAAGALLMSAPTATMAADAAGSSAAAAGKALVFNRTKGNCMACHAIAGADQTGNVGPALKNMKARFPDPKMLYKRIYDETKFNPRTVMPPFGRNEILTQQEIHDIVAYLLTL